MKALSEVCIDETTPEEFWSNYVCKRKPVVIKGHIADDEWQVPGRWTLDYLAEKAGSCDVVVEKRAGKKGAFGKGSKMKMNFSNFIEKLKCGDESLYLSAQQVPVGLDGFPDLFTLPLNYLENDFGKRPSLMGHLIPQQINVWIGNSKEGSSSGLHHDFHDNLYVLVKGKKAFKLFPPKMAERMYTVGKIQKAYENGRIVYEGQGDVLSDGSDLNDVLAWEKESKAKKALQSAEKSKNKEAIEKAEEMMDMALEAALDNATDDLDDDSDDDDESMDSDNEGAKIKKLRTNTDERAGGLMLVDAEDPPSFSKVDLGLKSKKLRKKFPDFPSMDEGFQCTVAEGDMLYLPAGWFHEVTSFTMPNSSQGHLAFNYWFHPPTKLNPSKKAFKQPYTSNFWPSVWEQRNLDDNTASSGPQNSNLNGNPRRPLSQIEESRPKRRALNIIEECIDGNDVVENGEQSHRELVGSVVDKVLREGYCQLGTGRGLSRAVPRRTKRRLDSDEEC